MRSSRPHLCDRAREWASLRVDGELSELENALLDSHLFRCDGCRGFVREAEAVATALRSVALEPAPAPVVLELPVRSGRRVPLRVLRTAVATGLVLAAAALGSALGVAGRSGRATTSAIRHTAMVAMADSPDNLRALRRPALILQSRPTWIPRNQSLNDTV